MAATVVKAIAYLTMAYTIGPMISPIVGGILIDAFGWRSVFGFALVAGVLITINAYAAVFESRPPSARETASGGNVFRDYSELFGHLRFTAFVLQSGFCTATFLVAATAASSLMKETLHRPVHRIRHLFSAFSVRLFVGEFRLQPRRHPRRQRNHGARRLAAPVRRRDSRNRACC